MDIAPALLTFGLNVLTVTLALGVSWGVYKTKITAMINDHTALLTKHENLEKTVKENADTTDSDNIELEKELNKKIDIIVKELNIKVDSSIKDIDRAIRLIENRCVAREAYVNSIPHLTEELNKVRMEVNALPSKLSNELTKTFSEEYQKIISVIVNKGQSN